MDPLSFLCAVIFVVCRPFRRVCRCHCRWRRDYFPAWPLLATGMPPHLALGTNKLQGSVGSMTAAVNYARKGLIDLREIPVGVFFYRPGSPGRKPDRSGDVTGFSPAGHPDSAGRRLHLHPVFRRIWAGWTAGHRWWPPHFLAVRAWCWGFMTVSSARERGHSGPSPWSPLWA